MKKTIFVAVVLALAWSTCACAQMGNDGNGKDYGAAINPIYALFGWVKVEFNVWKLDRTGEINIVGEYWVDPYFMDHDVNLFTAGANYRKFFNDRQEGFFVQGGLLLHSGTVDGEGELSGRSETSSQADIVFGMGYRLISQRNGLFWGLGFGIGRRFGEIKNPMGGNVRDDGVAFSLDLFKVGYAW